MEFLSKNIKNTSNIAKTITRELFRIERTKEKSALIVGLYGDLGVGKTTLTKAIAKELNIKRKVNSPTFVIMKRYVLKNKDFDNLFHLDAYRLKDEKELMYIGWEQIISNKRNLIFIEWPEQIIKAIPKKHYKIYISHLPVSKNKGKEDYRSFKIKNT